MLFGRPLRIWCYASFSLFLLSGCVSTKQQKSALIETPCQVQDESIRYRYECFYVSVPENYQQAESKQLLLPVIRFYSDDADSSKPPFIDFGGGGPGGPTYLDYASETINVYAPFSLEQGHDLILLDVRGVGRALPTAACPEIADSWNLFWDEDRSFKAEAELYSGLLKTCIGNWGEQGISPSQYNSQNVVRDIESIRQLLAIKSVVAIGNSYAARYAYSYARKYPEHTSNLVLISPALPGQYFEAFYQQKGVYAALQTLEEKFGQDAEALWSLFEKAYVTLNETPITLDSYFSDDDEYGYPVTLNGHRFLSTLFTSLYHNDLYTVLPYILSTDVASEKWRYVMGRLIGDAINTIYDESFSDPVYWATLCHEQLPHTPAKSEHEPRYQLFEQYEKELNALEQDICYGITNFGTSTLSDWQMQETNVPTLLLKGAADPVILDSGIQPFLQYFKHLVYKEIPGKSHYLVDEPCVTAMITEFVQSREVQSDTSTCRALVETLP